MCIGLHVKYPLFLSDFNETITFWLCFSQSIQISHFMTTRPVGTELFHADGRAHRHDEAQSLSEILRTLLKSTVVMCKIY
jgi:hypothetical protein